MLQTKRSNQRGYANHGWLQSYHSFSFANYYDPKNMGFMSLRVINEDIIAGGMGFGKHPHRDMEIITYIVKGALQHKDSMGNESIIKPGEVQYMSAGDGVFHSEFNPTDQETHLFQIWIMPAKNGGTPSYDQKSFEDAFASKPMVLVASGDGRDGSIKIRQDADLWIGKFKKNQTTELNNKSGRGIYLHVASGELAINGEKLKTGDALSIEKAGPMTISGEAAHSEILVFDLV
jgi:redox-sensitive bicupin YhaK (pirin superfamily)